MILEYAILCSAAALVGFILTNLAYSGEIIEDYLRPTMSQLNFKLKQIENDNMRAAHKKEIRAYELLMMQVKMAMMPTLIKYKISTGDRPGRIAELLEEEVA